MKTPRIGNVDEPALVEVGCFVALTMGQQRRLRTLKARRKAAPSQAAE
jgi:hypothetical protein